jgi:hypothetical protein
MRHRRACAIAFFTLISIASPHALFAQNLSGDARAVGLAGIDHAARIFSEDAGTTSTPFVIPLGLLQMLRDRQTLRPKSGSFDPTLALEYAALPAHYVFGRKGSAARNRFIADIRDASLNADLNVYRGFKPVATLDGGGILSPTWGKAFRVSPEKQPFVHKIYVGGGPYLALQTVALFDERLVNLLGASSATYVTNSTLQVGNQSTGQAAMQITGGYRGELPLSASGRLALEANYNHLHGFRYEDVDLNLRLDTNGQGLLRFDSPLGAPLAIDRRSASSGRGLAVDIAAAAVFDHWRLGVRADGLGNRINWKDIHHREYEMARLGDGASRLLKTIDEGAPDVRVTLPVELRLQGAYRDAGWGAIAELERGFQGMTASAAIQRRFSSIELRGGARFADRIVLPAVGVSLRAGRAWFDIGAAVTTANIERERHVVLASSIRFVFGHASTMASSPSQ